MLDQRLSYPKARQAVERENGLSGMSYTFMARFGVDNAYRSSSSISEEIRGLKEQVTQLITSIGEKDHNIKELQMLLRQSSRPVNPGSRR